MLLEDFIAIAIQEIGNDTGGAPSVPLPSARYWKIISEHIFLLTPEKLHISVVSETNAETIFKQALGIREQ
ncbi:MAG: hypothetical protein JO269_13400 [Burkholderiaceae bacterium]|nr:hypothetical protein [Burkholderiaceae bacterium]